MPTPPDRVELLLALRARLELDSGLGVFFQSLPNPNLKETLAKNLNHGLRPDSAVNSVSTARGQSRPLPDGPETSADSIAGSETEKPATVRSRLAPLVEAPPSPEKEAALADLRREAAECGRCGLCEKRRSVVWGEGSLDADVMFIGEAPGRDEDLAGRPFVGPSGRLLTDIIEKGMKIPRSGAYIANVVKCRPPGNRDPLPDETAACFRYLERDRKSVV